MNRWLLKTEPSTYSYDDLVREGRATWDGVSNPVALRHLSAMRQGDEALIYHTGAVKAVVGLARVVSAPYADPKLNDAKRVVVDLAPIRPLERPITLAAVKADPRFADFALVRVSRLSVMPVTETQWKALRTL